jgi:hypothetical protein
MAKQTPNKTDAISGPQNEATLGEVSGSDTSWCSSLRSPNSFGVDQEFFPYLMKPSLSASSISALQECSVAQGLKTWTAFRDRRAPIYGPDYKPPVLTKHAKLGKELSGEYSWMGNLTHDLFEDLLYLEIYKYKGWTPLETKEEIYARLLNTFASEWKKSREFTLESYSYLRQQTRSSARPVWLTGHALSQLKNRAIDEIDDDAKQMKMLQWMEAGSKKIYKDLLLFIDRAPISDWRVIEGRRILDGEILAPFGSTFEEARRIKHQPSFWITVDGFPLQVFCTMDFGFVQEREGKQRFIVTDLKTGKEKPEEHRRQLELYGVFVMEHDFGFAPDEIVLRLLYPQLGPLEVREYACNEEILEAARSKLLQDARIVLQGYVPLDHPAVTEQSLGETFSKREAQLLAGFGALRRGNMLPESVDARSILKHLIQSLSPLEMAQTFHHKGERVEKAFKEVVERSKGASYEMLNQDFLLTLFRNETLPSINTDPEKLLREMSSTFLLVPLPERFSHSAAASWEQRQKELKAAGKPLDPFHSCTHCQFVWFCEEGRSSSQLFELSMPPRTM